ncbi:PREDICTED: U-box domain-containing protein 62-like isoform X2 [Tarenaya hassleriana]|uniref:U-box domain-containing protein 62-like isoform X2 n=1 Tax=Tarenaya hassleriana TaxID=28532 RepID=UPI00053C3AC4|nr:PREDICTED: U-box domain-containing protein 62-like isoform X2 [Tarenaya hassleriana]
MSGKELSPVPLQQLGNAPPPLAVQDADPLRFRVGEPDPKTREFAAFIGDHRRYFAAAAAAVAAAAAAVPHPHSEFRRDFYLENPVHGDPHDSGGSDADEDDEEDDEMDGDDDSHAAVQDYASSRGGGGEGSSAGAVTIADPKDAVFYTQYFKTAEANSASRHREVTAVENGCGFSCSKEASSSCNSVDSLRAILSDPTTGALMDDAMVLPCGHSFGAGGIEQVKQMKACFTCSQPVSEDSITPNLTLRVAVQAFCREENLLSSHSSKRRREGSDTDKPAFGNSTSTGHPRNRSNQFPFSVADRVIIKGNKRTPPRFVGREAVITTQCLNGWYVVKTLDNAESVKLQYSSLAMSSSTPSKMVPNWL